MAVLDTSGLEELIRKLRTLPKIDATPLMVSWMGVIEEDNRKGVLAGLDRFGMPMLPVTYRPKPPAPPQGYRVTKAYKKEPARELEHLKHRHGLRRNARKGEFHGLGESIAGLNNNLTTQQYRLLGGPPLAPRDQFSRVITNFKTTFGGPYHGNSPNWYAEGAWDEVVSKKGVPFLRFHFEGIGQKRRDLRGVRPIGIAKAMVALRNWARLTVRELFGRAAT
jgi:hypothetical protein